MQGELKRLHRELGITFLMVTHDQTEALALSDRIVVMNQGRIAQIGSPTELYDNPASPYVADFIGATNLIEADAIGRDGDATLFRLANGTTVRSRCNSSAGPADGSKAMIGIRPERLHLTRSDSANALEFTVMESLFRGDRLRIELGLEGIGKPLFVELPRAAVSSSVDLAPGRSMTFHVEPTDVLVFAGGSEK